MKGMDPLTNDTIERGDSTYQIRLDFFEGPLDLLLHLVTKHELNIFDIPIAFIADEYLKYLDLMQTLNLDVASEFLLMAATLAHIKSREMLPDDESEEEQAPDGEDPKARLVRQLIEYQRFKEAALNLGERPHLGSRVFTRGVPVQQAANDGQAPLAEVGLFKLIEVFSALMSKAKVDIKHEILLDRITVAARLNELLDVIRKNENMTFSNCLKTVLAGSTEEGRTIESELVVTFLAILEMARLRLIRIRQATERGEIYVQATGAAPADSLDVDESYE